MSDWGSSSYSSPSPIPSSVLALAGSALASQGSPTLTPALALALAVIVLNSGSTSTLSASSMATPALPAPLSPTLIPTPSSPNLQELYDVHWIKDGGLALDPNPWLPCQPKIGRPPRYDK